MLSLIFVFDNQVHAEPETVRGISYKETFICNDGNKYGITSDGKAVLIEGNRDVATLVVPPIVKHGGVVYKVTAVAAYSCEGRSNLQEVIIANTVQVIGEFAFRDCSGLVRVGFPLGIGDGLKIDPEWLKDCKQFKKITAPQHVRHDPRFQTCFDAKSSAFLSLENSETTERKIGGKNPKPESTKYSCIMSQTLYSEDLRVSLAKDYFKQIPFSAKESASKAAFTSDQAAACREMIGVSPAISGDQAKLISELLALNELSSDSEEASLVQKISTLPESLQKQLCLATLGVSSDVTSFWQKNFLSILCKSRCCYAFLDLKRMSEEPFRGLPSLPNSLKGKTQEIAAAIREDNAAMLGQIIGENNINSKSPLSRDEITILENELKLPITNVFDNYCECCLLNIAALAGKEGCYCHLVSFEGLQPGLPTCRGALVSGNCSIFRKILEEIPSSKKIVAFFDLVETAVDFHFTEALQFLIQTAPDKRTQRELMNTALTRSYMLSEADVYNALAFGDSYEDVVKESTEGFVEQALKIGDRDTLFNLIDVFHNKGVLNQTFCSPQNRDDYKPLLQIALEAKDYELAEHLLAHGADVDVVVSSRNYSSDVTLLQLVLKNKDYELAEWLFSHGANVNIFDCHAGTFFIAAWWDFEYNPKLFNWLIAHGVDVNMDFQGQTFLQAEVESGHCELVEKLIDLGSPVDAYSSADVRTPLQIAIENSKYFGTDNRSIIESLIKHGAAASRLQDFPFPMNNRQLLDTPYASMIHDLLVKRADDRKKKHRDYINGTFDNLIIKKLGNNKYKVSGTLYLTCSFGTTFRNDLAISYINNAGEKVKIKECNVENNEHPFSFIVNLNPGDEKYLKLQADWSEDSDGDCEDKTKVERILF